MVAAVRQLAHDRRGVAAVEFAMVLPVLLLLLVGYLDVVHLARGHLRVQTAAAQVGQIISQCTTVSGGEAADGDVGQLRELTRLTLEPFLKTGDSWALVVTAIGRDSSGKPKRLWGTDNRTSAMKSNTAFASDGATLPDGYALNVGQVMFRTEVFAELDPTVFTKTINLLAAKMAGFRSVVNAAGMAMHTSRAPDTSRLNTNTSTEACLS